MKKTRLIMAMVLVCSLLLALGTVVLAAYEADSTWLAENPNPPTDYAYSIAVVGDTQTVLKKDLANGTTYLATLYDWIVANKEDKNIGYVLGLGDICENNTDAEWTYAKEQITKMDGELPYLLNRGNSPHDTVAQLNKYFASHESYTDSLVGYYTEGSVENVYTKVTLGSTKWLIFALDFGPKDGVISWAGDVIEANPDHRVIITTHSYLYTDGTTTDSQDSNAPTSGNTGEQMWDKLVSKYENIALVLSGHHPNTDIVRAQNVGFYGNTVTSMLINPQNFDAGKNGETGMVAMLYFNETGDEVSVEYISTVREQYLKEVNQFSLDLTPDGAIKNVGAMVDINSSLADKQLGPTMYLENDGYIGIPVQASLYYTGSDISTGVGGTPVIAYVVNTNTERVGTDSDVSIITSMLDRGYIVLVLDYLNNEKATTPDLDWSVQGIRGDIVSGVFFAHEESFPTGSYLESFVVPAGYDVSLGNVYWEIDKHSADGTLEYIVEVWNEDFRSVYANRIIKWVDENGERKATQNGYDGTSPVWLNADGSENAEGEYIKVKYTKAVEVTDCVKADGTPLDYNLYMNIIYPTNPVSAVPVMCLAGSGDHLASVAGNATRPQLNGFVFSGYAGVMYDHGYVPMARKEAYGEFSGSSSSAVTGDNVTYSITSYNDKKIHTAAMRFVRYLALSESDTYLFDSEAIGVYGNSKGGWMTFLGEEHPELLSEKRFFEGHHGETRYEAGKTTTVGIIDGGEEQPWLTYLGEAIDSGADLVNASCGLGYEHITENHAPTFITTNLQDSSYYDAQNHFINLCRVNNIPCLWLEVNVGHTLASGEDANWGVDSYEAFFTFANYYLRGDAVKVVYSSFSKEDTDIATDVRPVVKFSGAVSEEMVALITIVDAEGNEVNGEWTALYGNTEWSFTPDSALDLAETYTLTVPTDVKGDNGRAMAEAYTVSFTTKEELTHEVSHLATESGDYYYLTVGDDMPTAAKLILRFKVENNAANLVKIYPLTGFDSATPDSATVGETAIGACPLFGKGYYECDITDYVKSHDKGEIAAVLVKCEREAGTSTVFTSPLDSSLNASIGSVSYEFASDVEGIEGAGALKVLGFNTRNSSGTVDNVVYYSNPTAVLTVSNIVKTDVLDESDLGRSFNVSFRIYDTTSRRVQVYLRSATSQTNGIVDYGATRYNVTTKAGEWVDVSLDFVIHEPTFGTAGCIRKALVIEADTLGNAGTDYPLYIDSVESVETASEASLGEASLIREAAYVDPLMTPYGRIDEAYADETKHPLVIFTKVDGEWVFKASATALPTSYKSYGADTVVLFRTDYALSSSKYDLDSIGAGRSLTFDLGGNTLDITNGNRYNSLTSGAVNSITFNLINGSVYSNGMSSLTCIVGGNYANTVNLNYEDLKITLGESFGETSALIRHSQNKTATVTSVFNISFTDCDIDVSAINSDSLYVYRAGYSSSDGYDLNWYVNGGSFTPGDSLCKNNIITQKGGEIRFGEGKDGDYLELLLPEDTSITTAYTDEYGKDRYFAAVRVDGADYVHTLISLSTPYGDIPAEYASVLKYPFFPFYNGAAYPLADGKSYDLFTSTNLEVALRSKAGAVIIMRADYIVPSGTNAFGNASHHKDVTLDLMGFTLDGSAVTTGSGTLFAPSGATSTTADSKLTVKNGKIIVGKYLVSVVSNANATVDKTQGIYFENLEIDASYTSLMNYTSKSKTLNANIEFKDCSINSDTLTTVFRAGYSASDATQKVSLAVKGGKLNLGAFNQSKLVVVYSGSTVTFLTGSNGEMTTLNVPTGTAVSGTAYSGANGESLYLVEYANGEVYDEYRMESLVTKYGAIPYANSSRVDYPFHAFVVNGDGTYTYKTSNADFFKSGGMEYTLRSIANSVVLMRRDFTTSTEYTNLSNNPNTITIDLGGFTLTPGNMYGAIAAFGKHATTTNLTVKNGTILLDKYSFIVFGASTAGKTFNITLEDLTFALAEGATAKSVYGLVPHVTSSTGNYKAAFNANITIKDCVLDMSVNVPTGFTLLYTEDTKGYFGADVKLVGGELLLGENTGFLLADNTAGITFLRGGDNEYTVFKLKDGVSLPATTLATDLGEMRLVALGSDDGYKLYLLRDLEKLIAPKASLTLYSDFDYNLYIPVNSFITSITVGDTVYTELDKLEVVVIGGESYYRITLDIGIKAAADTFRLTIATMVDEESDYGYEQNWTLGVISYAEKLLSGSYTEVEKALAKDILAYIRAAYIFDGSDAEETTRVKNLIDEIIGADYVSEPDEIGEAVESTGGLDSAALYLDNSPAFIFFPELDENGEPIYSPQKYSFAIGNTTLITEESVVNGKECILVYTYAYAISENVIYSIEGTDIEGEYNLAAYLAFAEGEGDAELVALVKALWRYSDSAKAYRAEVIG
ncbi:MAG: Ig-like domain-containing protein [Clostridia bacterium]|nr:Ig-like domain-containing protein [Clostridia bacterium]